MKICSHRAVEVTSNTRLLHIKWVASESMASVPHHSKSSPTLTRGAEAKKRSKSYGVKNRDHTLLSGKQLTKFTIEPDSNSLLGFQQWVRFS